MASAVVQQAVGTAVNAAATATFGAGITSGNIIYVVGVITGSLDVTGAISGLTGGSWTTIRDQDFNGRCHKYLFKYVGGTSGTAVTLTPSGNGRVHLDILEVSGTDNTQDGVNSTGANSTAFSTGNVTTTAVDFVLIGVGFEAAGTFTDNNSAPWVALTGTDSGTSSHLRGNYRLSAAVATYNGSWSDTLTTTWEGLITAYVETAAAGGANYPPPFKKRTNVLLRM